MDTRDEPPLAPPRRMRRILLGIGALIAIALLVLWSVRKPIAEHVIARTLAERGVVARYTVTDLGLGRQRLTNVVIGDPAHPDLVADWIETETGVGLSGPELAGIRVGHARLRARLEDGRVSFGSLDRLLPAPSGRPFALPAIDARIGDARVRLETPFGLVGLSLAGAGRLDAGFRGRVAAASAGLRRGGCATGRASAVVAIRTAAAGPVLKGPARLASLVCGGVRAGGLGADVTAMLTSGLDGWRGQARLAVARAQGAGFAVHDVAGTVGFGGNARRTAGTVDLRTGDFVTTDVLGAGLAMAGRYAVAEGSVQYDGQIGGRGVALAPHRLAPIMGAVGRAAGTPAAPLLDRAVGAVVAAAKRFNLDVTLAAHLAGDSTRIAVSRLTANAASGAHAQLSAVGAGYDGAGFVLGRTTGAFGGGGLPEAILAVADHDARFVVQPYTAGAARLSLTPIEIAAERGTARLVTRATLSGPLGNGRVEGLTLPLDIRWRGAPVANPGCTTVAFDRLAVSGLTIAPSHASLCALGSGGLAKGARVGALALAGTLGRTPLTLAATGGRVDAQGFALDGVATRIGVADRATRIDVAHLAGRFARGAIGGTYAGAGGEIGAVPLRLADAAGAWRFAGGRLALDGTLTVRDTAAPARFLPLKAERVALTIAGDTIAATATLCEPTTATEVAKVAIVHALGSGAGHAALTVPALAFTETFQPELLTPLTRGVIEAVHGTIDGIAHIGWSADGVTSTGDFHTDGIDLAAAVGPVTGIAGQIHFTDLLALESAPGQVATVRTINPGIPVSDGTIRYQTLPGARVQVEQGDWPFAGGTLRLDPTLLDFSQPAERRMTFHVAHMAADQFLQQFDFKNLDASGIFDGVLPMIFDASGGRIEGGSLTVREGGGTLAYVGELGQKDLGTWGNIAFQALKSLRYRNLEIVMNGPLAGEMITEVKFAGISQGQGAKSNFLIRRLQKLPFVFNIRIKAPFRGLLDSAQSFYDPTRLVQRNLPALLEAQDHAAPPPIQPPASRIVP